MTDNHLDDDGDDPTASTGVDPIATAPITSRYKVLGLLEDPDGVGVLGQNDVGSGTPVGVQGAIPQGSAGYGLATPDDARITGVLDTGLTDFVVEADDDGTDNARNVVMGHSSNTATTGTATAFGATIRGGGESSNPNEAVGNYSTVGGGKGNTAMGRGATVAGGIGNEATDREASVLGGTSNVATAVQATVLGGRDNTAEGSNATVGGGSGTLASGTTGYSTVAGGQDNVVEANYATATGGTDAEAKSGSEYATVGDGFVYGPYATIGAGTNNSVRGTHSTVAGGRRNDDGRPATAIGDYATVPGGLSNTASGDYSFAAGREAEAVHDGAFVFGDSSSDAITSSGPDEVRSQMPIYAPSTNTTSARSKKTAIEPVDPESVLSDLETLGVYTWEFEREDDPDRHIGPMAGEFHDTFGVGADDGHISTVDADGVALASIQGVADRMAAMDDRIADLAEDLDGLDDARERIGRLSEAVQRGDDRLSSLEAGGDREKRRIADVDEETDAVGDRLAALEAELGIEAGDGPSG